MIVVDASAILEVILRAGCRERLLERLLGSGELLVAPHLLDLEVVQVLRRFVAGGEVSEARAVEALDDYGDLRINRYPHDPLLQRVWQLRHNCTAYDGIYVALAESLDCPLVTCDKQLAGAPGHRATIELFAD